MRTLLVVTKQSSMAAAIGSVLEPDKFQLITKEDVVDAEFLLNRGAIDATILDTELTDSRALRAVDEIKRFAPSCPIIIYTSTGKQWEWEEDAYLQGVHQVLTKPVRGKLLNTLLQRLFPEPHPALPSPPSEPAPDFSRSRPSVEPVRALEALRRFSGVLSHSLDPSALLTQFLLLLREVIGVNRAIIFLRKPSGLLSENPLSAEDRWLRSACAIGLDQNVLQHFALSLGAGIGGYLHRQGRILRAGSSDAQASREISKEFQLLGAQVAIPILDRQSLLGVAVFDERLTGEAYANEELSLIFHMLEEVGLAIRNSWLHGQLHANHAMIADILGHLGSGCLVIGSNLQILHANCAAMRILLGETRKAPLEFSDLPQQIGSLVFTVVKSGVPVPAFKNQFSQSPDRWHRIAIMPFVTQTAGNANAALLIIEDITEHERAVKLELETSNLRLVKAMAEHLAHEIGNALVPMSTHQQLMKDSINDVEFQESLSHALATGVKRISRLASQMNFLAREWTGDFSETVQIADLIVEAFHEAHTYHPGKKVAQLSFNKNVAPWKITGDSKALRHAFSEIILNALQANPEAPAVAVNLQERKEGEHELQVEVRDTGAGFTHESARRAAEPFFSTRNVGLGIGLTVSRKIIESHHGRLEIPPSETGQPGVVRISLPIPN
ncbi:MAG TPA: ATP-binding protein [Chthoniobacteraceae bacterium]|jgi:signal transduction histidine kinase